MQLGIFCRFLRLAEDGRRFRQNIRRVGEVGLVHQSGGCRSRGEVVAHARIHGGGIALAVIHPARHRIKMVGEESLVAIGIIHDPGNNDARIAPHRVRLPLRPFGRNTRIRALRSLGVVHVHRPFGKETRHIRIERRRGREHLRVAHPAHALVALWAIRRDADVIAALAPADVGIELVQVSAGRFPRASRRRIGAHHHPANIVRREFTGIAVDLRVPKTVKSEMRFKSFGIRAAFHNKRIEGNRAAQIFVINAAIGIEHFRMGDIDDRVRRAACREADMPNHVLAKIHYPVRTQLHDFLWCQFHELSHRRTELRDQRRAAVVLNGGVGPAFVIKSNLIPWQRFARIQHFAHLIVGANYFARAAFPRAVRGDDIFRAIGISDFQLRVEQRMVTDRFVLIESVPAQPPGKPAIAQQRADHVRAGFEQLGDIRDLHHHPRVVIRKAGIQLVVIHALAVDARLIHAKRRGIKARTGHRPFYGENLAQVATGANRAVGAGHRLAIGVRANDRRRRPGGFIKSGRGPRTWIGDGGGTRSCSAGILHDAGLPRTVRIKLNALAIVQIHHAMRGECVAPALTAKVAHRPGNEGDQIMSGHEFRAEVGVKRRGVAGAPLPRRLSIDIKRNQAVGGNVDVCGEHFGVRWQIEIEAHTEGIGGRRIGVDPIRLGQRTGFDVVAWQIHGNPLALPIGRRIQ